MAGFFVLITIPISVYGVALHIEHYSCPKLQKHVVRILWMPCVYGLASWLGLRFKDAAIYFDTMRECYEAFVIYNFFTFLEQYLGQARERTHSTFALHFRDDFSTISA